MRTIRTCTRSTPLPAIPPTPSTMTCPASPDGTFLSSRSSFASATSATTSSPPSSPHKPAAPVPHRTQHRTLPSNSDVSSEPRSPSVSDASGASSAALSGSASPSWQPSSPSLAPSPSPSQSPSQSSRLAQPRASAVSVTTKRGSSQGQQAPRAVSDVVGRTKRQFIGQPKIRVTGESARFLREDQEAFGEAAGGAWAALAAAKDGETGHGRHGRHGTVDVQMDDDGELSFGESDFSDTEGRGGDEDADDDFLYDPASDVFVSQPSLGLSRRWNSAMRMVSMGRKDTDNSFHGAHSVSLRGSIVRVAPPTLAERLRLRGGPAALGRRPPSTPLHPSPHHPLQHHSKHNSDDPALHFTEMDPARPDRDPARTVIIGDPKFPTQVSMLGDDYVGFMGPQAPCFESKPSHSRGARRWLRKFVSWR